MGIELERHPPERGALPVVVAGGCCTTCCCCCCCCCAYVVGGLAGAAIGSAIASTAGDSEARRAVGRYWKFVGGVFGLALLFALLGLAVPASFAVAAGIVVAMPIFQAIASVVMFRIPDRAARRAALIVTLLWLALTAVGAWLTVSVFHNMVDDLAKVPVTPP